MINGAKEKRAPLRPINPRQLAPPSVVLKISPPSRVTYRVDGAEGSKTRSAMGEFASGKFASWFQLAPPSLLLKSGKPLPSMAAYSVEELNGSTVTRPVWKLELIWIRAHVRPASELFHKSYDATA